MSMQEAEEQDTCRICSAPAEPDQPLFHPCKCSGTIRYIHQDCLTTWLAHSKKKNCDVCKHPYAFTKVYAPDMPPTLPPLLLLKRLLQQLFWALLFVLRAVAVTAIWLGVLPWVTVWTWRMYFSMGESTAWWISDRPRPPSSEPPLPFYSKILASSSLLSSLSASTPTSPATSALASSLSPTSIPTHTLPIPVPTGFLAKISTHPLWLALSADIFAGQIIASLIVLVFVAIFLLREWISQNARPGVFEEEDAPAPVAPGPVVAPALGAAAGAALQGQMVGLLAAQNDADFNARLDALIRDAAAGAAGVGPGGEIGPPPPEVRARLEHVLGAERAEEVIRDFMARQAAAGAPGNGANNRRNNNAVVLDPEIAADPDRWSTTDDDHGSPAGAKRPRVKRKKLHRERERIRRARRQHRVGRAGAEYGIVVPGEGSEDEDDQAGGSGEGSASGQGALGFAFPPHRDSLTASTSGPSTSMSASTSVSSALAHSPPQSSVSSPPPLEEHEERARESEADDPAASETTLNPADLTSTSIFPTVSLQPPSGSIPFSLRSVNTSSSNLASSSTPTPYSATLPHSPPPYSASSSSSPYPARPPLPSAGLPLPKSASGSPFLHSASPVPGRTPAESPSVSVTYRAPEELGRDGEDNGEGSSSGFVLPPPGYFDRKNERGKRKRDADDEADDADSETEEDEETLLEGYSYDEDVDMDVDMDVDVGADNEDEDGDQRRPGKEREQDQEQLFDSDVDMEAERRRYFREEGAGTEQDPNLPGPARAPSSSSTSSSSSSEDAGEEEEDDLHHDHHHHHEHEHIHLLEDNEEEEEEEFEFDEEEDDEDDVEGQWEVAEVDPAAAAAAIAAGQAAAGVGVAAPGQPQGPNALNAAAARARNRADALRNLNANVNANGNGNGNGNANGVLDQDAAAAAALAAEELDGNVEDDMEGAMEAIGMRGPIYGVLQNAALMIFVLDTAIGLGVWIPFTIGKTTALLSLDPHRMLQVLHLPIRAMRVVTDPFVDFIQWVLVDLVLPWVLRLLGLVLKAVVFVGSLSAGKVLGEETREGVVQFGMKLYNQSVDLVNLPLSQLSAWTSPSNLTHSTSFFLSSSLPTTTNSTSSLSPLSPLTSLPILSTLPDYLGFTEPYFESLGREVRESTAKFQTTWVELALGSGPTNRLFAVVLGYGVVALLLGLYLNVLTVGNARSAGRHVRNAVRQQLLVTKVATFIFIELVVFPLGCGIVLDLCTVWLFPEANLQSRISFFLQAPLTAMFYHWVAGTMFMYSFAVLLSGCRSVMRPGAMWFIKDPQDQNSHPIRDILDRPTLVQLRKIFVSGIMYSFVVACVVGSVAGLVLVGNKSIMPFRWKNREPLSNVPVDLLFLHLVLPYTMHYFRPKRTIKQVTTTVWKYLATRLRLTSYFFGGRHPEEEYTPKDWRDNFRRDGVVREGVPDGSFRRVPATDNLALPRDMRATVAVNADGEPLDEAARNLMNLQNAEAEKAKRTIADDYMVVYMPPQFRYRIILFITLLWIFGAICLGFAVALPIQLGRSFFRLFTLREVHDGYSFIVGFYLVWTCYLVARAIDRLDKRRQRRGGEGPRAELPVLVLKRGLLWLAKTGYMVFFLGGVVPVLLAIVIDLYVVLPIRFMMDPGHVPRIRIVDAWALGLLYAQIGMHAHRLQPGNRISRGLQRIKAHGWTRPDPVTATKEVIVPLIGGLLGMILLPGLVFRAVQYIFPGIAVDDRSMFMHVYPTVFVCAFAFRASISAYGLLSTWSQSIRDKEFLVEMRLKNHDPDRPESDTEEGVLDWDQAEVNQVNNRDRAGAGR